MTNYCPNCYNQIEGNLKECPRCFTKLSRNLENFLLAKYKIFTLIGVFGALSIYLSTASQQNGDDPILRAGSFFSLIIVLIFSLICIWDLFGYIRIEEPDYNDLSVSDILKGIKALPAIIMFLGFFMGLILILTLYILSNAKIGQAIFISLFIISVLIFAIAIVYHPYKYAMEKYTNIWIRGLISFGLIISIIEIIKNQLTVLPLDIGNLSLSTIFSIILTVLLLGCLNLMFEDMVSYPKKLLMNLQVKSEDSSIEGEANSEKKIVESKEDNNSPDLNNIVEKDK